MKFCGCYIHFPRFLVFLVLCLLWSNWAFAYQVEWKGKILDARGKPAPLVHIAVRRGFMPFVLTDTQTNSDGSFRLRADVNGLVQLRFRGLHHQEELVHFYIKKPQHFHISVQLGTKYMHQKHHLLRVRLESKQFASPGMLLKRRSDGRYALEVKTRRTQEKYFLANVSVTRGQYWGNMAGTEGQGYKHDERRGFLSVVKTRTGKVSIVFDPQRLPPNNRPFRMHFVTADPWQSSFQNRYKAYRTGIEGIRRAYRKKWAARSKKKIIAQNRAATSRSSSKKNAVSRPSKQTRKVDKYDLTAFGFHRERWGRLIEKRLQREKDPTFRNILLLWYLRLLSLRLKDPKKKWVMALCRLAESNEDLWSDSTAAYLIWGFIKDRFSGASHCSVDLKKAIDSKRDPGLRAFWLTGVIRALQKVVQKKKKRPLFLRSFSSIAPLIRQIETINKKIPISPKTYWFREFMKYSLQSIYKGANTRPKMHKGVSMPLVTFQTLSKKPKKQKLEPLLKGHVSIIHFWSTWCGACLANMAWMHKIHRIYSPRGLQIISVSLDQVKEQIRHFRKTKWSMPWLHLIETRGFESPGIKALGLSYVPSLLLIDGKGSVIANQAVVGKRGISKRLKRLLPKKTRPKKEKANP